MKKKRPLLPLLGLFAALLFPLWGCEQYVLPEIVLSPDTLRFTASSGVLPVEVRSNVRWTATVALATADWLSVGESGGKGTMTVGIEVTDNFEEERTGTIVFQSETLRKNLVVIQASGL